MSSAYKDEIENKCKDKKRKTVYKMNKKKQKGKQCTLGTLTKLVAK